MEQKKIYTRKGGIKECHAVEFEWFFSDKTNETIVTTQQLYTAISQNLRDLIIRCTYINVA